MRLPTWKPFCCVIAVAALITGPIVVAVAGTPDEGFSPYWTEHSGVLYGEIDKGLYVAVDVASGSTAWQFRDDRIVHFTKPEFADGVGFVAGATTDSESELLRLNLRTGNPEWRTSFVNLAGNASSVVCGTSLLLHDFSSKVVVAFDTRTGGVQWRTDQIPYALMHPPVIFDNNRAMYLALPRNEPNTAELVTLECSSGHVTSTVHVSNIGLSRNPLLLTPQGLLRLGYEGPPSRTRLQMVELDTFKERWSVSIPDDIARFTPCLSGDALVGGGSSIWVADLASGKTRHRYRLPKPTVPIAVSRNRALFSWGDSGLAAYDISSGHRLWVTQLKGRITSNVTVAGERIIVAVDSRQLAVLGYSGQIEKYIDVVRHANGER